jgi:hypothetical protein
LSEFGKNSRSDDGLRYRCRLCHNKGNKEWSDRNREKTRAASHNWYINNKEKAGRNDKVWREKNKERKIAQIKKWRDEHPEKYREYSKTGTH